MSTEEGKRDALGHMLSTMIHIRPNAFLDSPVKIIAAITRLEELQCLNTAEVVIMWAWTVGIINAADRDGWRLIGDNTLRFYQTHGIGRLARLKQHITDTSVEHHHCWNLQERYEDFVCRVGRVKSLLPGPFRPQREGYYSRNIPDLRISQACQLRRLYLLFGCDSMMWKEAVVVGGVGEATDIPLGSSVRSAPFMDWACDYP